MAGSGYNRYSEKKRPLPNFFGKGRFHICGKIYINLFFLFSDVHFFRLFHLLVFRHVEDVE